MSLDAADLDSTWASPPGFGAAVPVGMWECVAAATPGWEGKGGEEEGKAPAMEGVGATEARRAFLAAVPAIGPASPCAGSDVGTRAGGPVSDGTRGPGRSCTPQAAQPGCASTVLPQAV